MGFFKRLFGSKKSEQKQVQAQIVALFEEMVDHLQAEIYRRSIPVVERSFPNLASKLVAAHVKMYCVGESEDEKSLAASTPVDREAARQIADEIMALDVHGLYGVPATSFVETIQGLPDNPESIRRLALCYDQYAVMLISTAATDMSNPLEPRFNRDYIRENALPLIANAEKHDPNNSVLQTTIAQTYYTLGELDRGLEAAESARDLSIDNAEAWRLCGNGYLAQGRQSEARDCYERAIELNPFLDGVYEALALLS